MLIMTRLHSSYDLCGLTNVIITRKNFKFTLAEMKSFPRIEMYKFDERC